MRAIDADALVKELISPTGLYADCERCSWSISNECMDCIIEDVIKRMPTIESVKSGKWINTYGDTPHDARDKNNWWHCSECKYSVTTMFKSPYCPECGARMKGVKE